MNHRYSHILTPVKIGNVILKNRLLSSKVVSAELQGPQKYPAESTIAYMENLAKNGAALVTVSAGAFPNRDGSYHPMAKFRMDDREVQNVYLKMLDRIHAHGSLASTSLMQIESHDFAISDTPNWDDIPKTGDYSRNFFNKPGISRELLKETIDGFGRQSLALKKMGFDMVTVYMSYRGSMLANSLSPVLNQRTDEYGGSLENRARLTLEIFRRIKALCGPDFLIEAQVSAVEEAPGYTLDEFLDYCKMCEGLVDIFQIRGWDGADTHVGCINYSRDNPVNLKYAEAFKKRGIRALCAPIGGFQNLDVIERVLAEGKTDLVSMGRAFIADPEYGKKLYEGRGEDVVPCIRCNKCHGAVCSVNPKNGLAHVYPDMFPARTAPKKVAVIGGGPAGMKAALTAAGRGHQVTLFEKADCLGGQLSHSDYAAFKAPVREYKDYLIRELGKSGVEIRLGTEATPGLIEAGGFGAVIAACGSSAAKLDIPGGDGSDIWDPEDVFADESKLGKKVAVIGGGEIGVETALYLAQCGHQVTALTRQPRFPHSGYAHAYRVMAEAVENEPNLRYITQAHTVKLEPGAATFRDVNGEIHVVEADSIVVAAGRSPRADEAFRFAGITPLFYTAGDCKEGTSVLESTRDGYCAAMDI